MLLQAAIKDWLDALGDRYKLREKEDLEKRIALKLENDRSRVCHERMPHTTENLIAPRRTSSSSARPSRLTPSAIGMNDIAYRRDDVTWHRWGKFKTDNSVLDSVAVRGIKKGKPTGNDASSSVSLIDTSI